MAEYDKIRSMKVVDVINSEKFTISFEVFPPKESTSFDVVKTATEEIAKLNPAFMSVTYGAGGGVSQYTIDIAKNIEQKYSVPMLAHLTCVSSSKQLVQQKIEDIKAAGVKNIMALRGDLTPELAKGDRSTWDYTHASQLVAQIKKDNPDFCIGGACYPEVHPESKTQQEDIAHLKEKVDAGCDFLTTQMFFDNNLFFNFMDKLREAGITVPVCPGIMPITNAKQVDRAINLSGSFMPNRFKAIVDMFGTDVRAMQQAGIAYATDQIIDLFANGISHVHVYSMNKPEVAQQIMLNLSEILGKNLKPQ